jgi:hypothetical protein
MKRKKVKSSFAKESDGEITQDLKFLQILENVTNPKNLSLKIGFPYTIQ